jgi:hypothetical protein
MSQRQVSIKIERTCEGCGKATQYELANPSENTVKELQTWYTVIREFWDGREFQKMMVQACSLACVPVAAAKLVVIEQVEDTESEINLADLRLGQN